MGITVKDSILIGGEYGVRSYWGGDLVFENSLIVGTKNGIFAYYTGPVQLEGAIEPGLSGKCGGMVAYGTPVVVRNSGFRGCELGGWPNSMIIENSSFVDTDIYLDHNVTILNSSIDGIVDPDIGGNFTMKNTTMLNISGFAYLRTSNGPVLIENSTFTGDPLDELFYCICSNMVLRDSVFITSGWYHLRLVNVNNVTIERNYFIGAQQAIFYDGLAGREVRIYNNSFNRNEVGLYISDGASLNLIDNSFHNNRAHGIEYGSSATTVTSQGRLNIFNNGLDGGHNRNPSLTKSLNSNWWGDASGPYHSTDNPGGLGDNVSDGITFSGWASQPFPLMNAAPWAPLNLSLQLPGNQPDLSWDGFDLDDDPLTYNLTIGTSVGGNQIMGPVQFSQPTYLHPSALSPGTYHIRIIANDSYFDSDPLDHTFTIAANNPPSVPSNILPDVTTATMPNITWTGSTDADFDPVTYQIAIGSQPSTQNVLNWVSTGANPWFQIGSPLTIGTYHVQVRAFDEQIYSATLEEPMEIVAPNSAPQPPTWLTPAISNDSTPDLVWGGASDPQNDTLTYFVKIGTDVGLADIAQTAELTSSSYTVTTTEYHLSHYCDII